jgi:hypothetical protein
VKPVGPVRIARRARLLACAALALGAAACNQDAEVLWDQFNATDDSVQIEVGIDEVLDPVEIVLHSSTGEVEVGLATVDPGGGPVGTLHEVVVVVADDYADIVDRASIRTDSGDRGEDEYDLDQDSAEEGVYKLTIESDGAAGEVRTDTLTFRLWDEIVVEETTDDSSDDGGSDAR